MLKDPEKREIYDQYGEEAIKEGMGNGGGGGGMADLFEMMTGQRRGGGAPRERRGEDVVHKLKCTLAEMYKGGTRKLAMNRKTTCGPCSGTGTKSGRPATCQSCQGQGVVIKVRQMGPMIQQVQMACPECSGTGEMVAPGDRCEPCQGKKVVPERKVFEVNVEPGMKHGQKITLRGEAGVQQPGVLPGDLVFVLVQQEHAQFQRKATDLLFEKEITLAEALCGFTYTIDHLDGRQLVVSSPGGGEIVRPDDWVCVPDEGMPLHGRPFEKGNLYIHYQVKFPAALGADERAALGKLLSLGKQADVDMEAEMTEPVTSQVVRNMEEELKSRQAYFKRNRQAYDSDDGDDDMPRGGRRVQCAQS